MPDLPILLSSPVVLTPPDPRPHQESNISHHDILSIPFFDFFSNLLNEGDTVTVNVTFPATSTVKGTVFQSDGVTPFPFVDVYVENLDNRRG